MVLSDRTAIEVGERAVNNGRAGGGEGVRKLVQAVGAIELLLREAVRDCGLVFVEDVDGSVGLRERDVTAFAVMPCRSSPRRVVITVTPVAKRPMARRNSSFEGIK